MFEISRWDYYIPKADFKSSSQIRKHVTFELEVSFKFDLLPNLPKSSTPRAANMKNNRKKRSPKLPTWM